MIFVFGGGPITLDEMKLAEKHSIPVFYIPVERKFMGDKKTKVTNNHSESDRIVLRSFVKSTELNFNI